MQAIDALRETLPEAAKDLKIGLSSVLGAETLNEAQRFGVAVACALAARNPALRDAVLSDAAAAGIAAEVIDDARAAAALMGMNNVFYRSRHMLGGDYESRPARLRMQRIAQPKSVKADFELMCLAVSAINGCEVCLKSHEKVILDAGMSQEQIFDAVRMAAVIHGVACALEMGV